MAMDEAQLEEEVYAAIWVELIANGFIPSAGNTDNRPHNDRFVRAVAKGVSKVVPHIVARSELVPVTTDTGTAGAGIRTGTVK